MTRVVQALVVALVVAVLPVLPVPTATAQVAPACVADAAGDHGGGLDLLEVCTSFDDVLQVDLRFSEPVAAAVQGRIDLRLGTPIEGFVHDGQVHDTSIGSMAVRLSQGVVGVDAVDPVGCGRTAALLEDGRTVRLGPLPVTCIGDPAALALEIAVQSSDAVGAGRDCAGDCFGGRIRVPAIPNDDLGEALPVAVGGTAPIDVRAATDEPGEAPHGGVGHRSVWYALRPDADAAVTVTTAGADVDTVLAVYTGGSVDDLTEVAVADDDPEVLTSSVRLDVTAGTTYRIAVSGYEGAIGTGTLQVLPAGSAVHPIPPEARSGRSALADLPQAEGTLAMFDQSSTGRSPVDVALAFSQATFPHGAPVVTFARSDTFPDALASGLLQQDGPLLLLPPEDVLPASVEDEVRRLAPAQVRILGGPAAVSPGVESALRATGVPVSRLGGTTRFETAAGIAATVGGTGLPAVVVRGDDAGSADPSTAFADSLAAGGLAAARRWPVLLTGQAALPQPTHAALQQLRPSEILVVGGPAAVSDAVVEALRAIAPVRRIAGATRVDTALAVAGELAVTRSGSVGAVTVVDGHRPDGWVGGLVAASRTAATGAPVLLGAGDVLPAATADWMRANVVQAGGQGDVVVACVVAYRSCEEARRVVGLSATPLISVDPPGGTVVDGPMPVRVSVDPPAQAAGLRMRVFSSCGGPGVGVSSIEVVLDAAGQADVDVRPDEYGGCSLHLAVALPGGEARLDTSYLPAPPDDGPLDTPRRHLSLVAASEPRHRVTPVVVDVTGGCTRPDGAAADSEVPVRVLDYATDVHKALRGLGYLESAAPLLDVGEGEPCSLRLGVPPETLEVRWEVVDGSGSGSQVEDGSRSAARAVLAAGHGTDVAFEVPPDAPLGLLLDLRVDLRLATTTPTAAPLSPPLAAVPVDAGFYQDLEVRCDDGTVVDGRDDDVRAVLVPSGASCRVDSPSRAVVLHAGRPVDAVDDPTFVADGSIGPVHVRAAVPPAVHGGLSAHVASTGALDRPLVVPVTATCPAGADQRDVAVGLHPPGAAPFGHPASFTSEGTCRVALDLPSGSVDGASWTLVRETYDSEGLHQEHVASGTGLEVEVPGGTTDHQHIRWTLDLTGPPPPAPVPTLASIPVRLVYGAANSRMTCDDGTTATATSATAVGVRAGSTCTVVLDGAAVGIDLVLARWNEPFTIARELRFTATADGGPLTILTTAPTS